MRASNGKIGLLERHLLHNPNTDGDPNDEHDDDDEAQSDEGCFLSDDDVMAARPTDFIDKLPRELATLVMLHLPNHHCLLACSRVSRSWRAVAQDTIIWRDFFHRNPGWRLKAANHVEWCLSHLPAEDGLVLLDDAGASGFNLRSLSASIDLLRRNHNPPLRLERLNWRRIYAARYHLARRWGEVAPTSTLHHQKVRLRHEDAVGQRLTRVNRPTAGLNEEWDDDDDDEEQEALAADSSDEEQTARVRVILESRLARDALDTRRGNFSVKAPKRWLPRIDPPELRIFGSHEDLIYCVRTFPSFSGQPPSAGYIVTGSRDRTIRVWDIQSGQCLHVLRHHSRSILSMDVCSQGDILVSGASDQMLGIWAWFGSPEAREATRRGQAFEPFLLDVWHCNATIMDVRLSDDYMVLGLRNGQVRCYKRTTTRSFERVSVYHGHECSVNDLNIQGDYVAAGYAGGPLEVIHIPTGKLYRKFVHKKGVACVGFKGDILVAGASDFVIRCWRVSTGQLLLTLRGHTELPRSVRFDAERGFLLSAGYDGRINIWDVSLILKHDVVQRTALGPDWRTLAVFYEEERLWAEDHQSKTRLFQEQIAQRLQQTRERTGTALEGQPPISLVDDERQGAGNNSPAVRGQQHHQQGPPPPPHPFHDPAIPHRPRFFFREKPSPANDNRGDHERPHREGCRLFDAAFDGKRIIAVGESHEFTVREFLPEHERFHWKWEIFG